MASKQRGTEGFRVLGYRTWAGAKQVPWGLQLYARGRRHDNGAAQPRTKQEHTDPRPGCTVCTPLSYNKPTSATALPSTMRSRCMAMRLGQVEDSPVHALPYWAASSRRVNTCCASSRAMRRLGPSRLRSPAWMTVLPHVTAMMMIWGRGREGQQGGVRTTCQIGVRGGYVGAPNGTALDYLLLCVALASACGTGSCAPSLSLPHAS